MGKDGRFIGEFLGRLANLILRRFSHILFLSYIAFSILYAVTLLDFMTSFIMYVLILRCGKTLAFHGERFSLQRKAEAPWSPPIRKLGFSPIGESLSCTYAVSSFLSAKLRSSLGVALFATKRIDLRPRGGRRCS